MRLIQESEDGEEQDIVVSDYISSGHCKFLEKYYTVDHAFNPVMKEKPHHMWGGRKDMPFPEDELFVAKMEKVGNTRVGLRS